MLITLPWHLRGDSTVLGVNKWRRRVQYIHLAAVSACTCLGSYGTGSLALQIASTADCKTVGVNLCTKTKCGGGECSSVSGVFFFPSVLLQEEGLNTVMFFRRTEKWGKEAFYSRLLFSCVSGKHGRCSMWMEKLSMSNWGSLKTLLFHETFYSVSILHVILCSNMSWKPEAF